MMAMLFEIDRVARRDHLMKRWRTHMPSSLLGLVALLAAAPPALAEGDSAVEVERGELLFRIHCASCHGAAAAGNGPLAEDLRRPPSDLTRLNDGGAFPAKRVRRAIDGRDEVTGHGSREMPIWGLSFQQGGRDADQEEEVRSRVLDLVEFLRSIQLSSPGEPAEPPDPD
jgi:mono/diheme cytochrome c family protein